MKTGIERAIDAVDQVVSARDALRSILATREAELLELKGPCSNKHCRLHYAHAGPCDT